jgi:hypothetical protein
MIWHLAVAELRLLHAELSLNEKILLPIASFSRGDYRIISRRNCIRLLAQLKLLDLAS